MIAADGSRSEGGDLTGYSIIEADDLDHAATLVSGCPNLASGGGVSLYEAVPM
jgi:hypothetical protein